MVPHRRPTMAPIRIQAAPESSIGQRLYQLIRQSGDVGEHVFTIEFLDPGVQAYSFTFG